jgi:hypothetical protein
VGRAERWPHVGRAIGLVSAAQRESVELSRTGLHWEDIDEDISIAGLLAGRGDMTRKTERAA